MFADVRTDAHAAQRRRMVDAQIASRGIRSAAVLRAMREVPRERFVEPALEEFAYEDTALPIAGGQTISQPYIVALMIEAADPAPADRVLEVGAGSGYAAAVLSRIAARVLAVERDEALADAARQRLLALGYANAAVHAGDGSRGWPEEAPFDVIIVSAGGPAVPGALEAQLAVGGRLVMPVGGRHRQRIVKLTRTGPGPDELAREDIASVAFVPLVGEHGWAEGDAEAEPRARESAPPPPAVRGPLRLLRQALEPLPPLDDPAAFGAAFDRFGEHRVVMLGEATHGSAEFYRARAAVSRRLIEQHGFNLLALEADWPDAAVVDRYVRMLDDEPAPRLRAFERFPTWLWRNHEFAAFVGWLRQHNQRLAPPARVAVYGLDIYNLGASIAAVLDYLDRHDPQAAALARERYGCLTPWQRDPASYGRAAMRPGFRRCEEAVVQQCRELLARRLDEAVARSDRFLDAMQNARLVAAAEAYYRLLVHGGPATWNLRDSHMFDTLQRLLAFKGLAAKAIVWAHNSHVGDARFTDMGQRRDEHNIGQLARQAWGRDVALIGQDTHAGSVAAAHEWDGELQVMPVQPSRPDSLERLCHDADVPRFLLDLRPGRHDAARAELARTRLQRYIGVIYRPETERWSHYAEAALTGQYDALVWFDQTQALAPLAAQAPAPAGAADDTYPFGL